MDDVEVMISYDTKRGLEVLAFLRYSQLKSNLQHSAENLSCICMGSLL